MHQISAICFSIFLVIVLSSNSEAKRGCNAFGHSCFGGHGKRSEVPVQDNSIETPYPILKLLQESARNDMEQPLPKRTYDNALTDEADMRFSVYELLKNWMDDYRRVHQTNGQVSDSQRQMKTIEDLNNN